MTDTDPDEMLTTARRVMRTSLVASALLCWTASVPVLVATDPFDGLIWAWAVLHAAFALGLTIAALTWFLSTSESDDTEHPGR